ncbi:hypothetical protein E2562_032631 [Oryza meyeriana var. granulata]|uniref:HMA domain-containing protein n=1 Tax=Oryza meyeriana var. granulata TaxID=110450 RepID=A0A6G1DBZ3_9ORYZ|nr:hypothetical protein E2562_032631 [Oryza meyeriana var. granulata]
MAKWRSWKPAGGSDGGAAAVGGEGEKKAEIGAAAGELVISVPVHCDGCARKLRRSVQRLDGVEEVTVDCRTDTVVVRGPKAAADPAGVVEVVDRRTGKKALLLSSSPAKPPSSPEKKSTEEAKKDGAEQGMGKEMAEEDMEMVVVMRIELHCEECCEEIKRRILKIKGVEEVVPHMKSSQVMVRGKIEPATLAGLIHKWTGRKAAIFRAEPLHPLPPPSQSPPPPPKVDDDEPPKAAETQPEKEETKHGGPSPSDDHVQDKKEGDANEKDQKEEGPDEKKEGKADDDLKPQMENPNDASNDNGVAEENHSTKDHLFREG